MNKPKSSRNSKYWGLAIMKDKYDKVNIKTK